MTLLLVFCEPILFRDYSNIKHFSGLNLSEFLKKLDEHVVYTATAVGDEQMVFDTDQNTWIPWKFGNERTLARSEADFFH